MSEISDLFQKDPLKYTVEDRRKIIEKYREDRRLFLLGEKPKRAEKQKLDLDSLDLDSIDL